MTFLQKSISVFAVFLLLFIANIQAQTTTKVKWTEMSNNKNASFYDVQKDFYKKWRERIKEMNREKRKANAKGKAVFENEGDEAGYEQFKRWESYMAPRVFPSGNMTLPSTNYANFLSWQQNQNSGNRPVGTFGSGNWTEIGPIGSPGGPIPPYSDPYTRTGAGRVNFIRIDPNNANNMFIGAPDGGLWKSTNGGTSWTTNTDFLTVIGCSDLVIDPTNSQVMYLATGDLEGNRRSAGILKSTNGGATWNTTGLTWTPADNYKISKLLMNPSDPLNMIISTDGGIFRTTNGWVSATQGNFPSGLPDLKDMEFKPGNANTVYASGTEIWKSIDNGVNWVQVTTGLPSTNISRIALGVTAGNSAYVYALIGKYSDQSFLGLYRSVNSGTSFSVRSTSPNLLGYEFDGSDAGSGQAFYDLSIAVSPTNAEQVTTGGVNHWQSSDGGTTWTNLSVWNSGEVHADIHEVTYLPGSSTTMFSCNDGGIFKSTDNGTTFVDISNNLAISQNVGIGLSANLSTTIVNGTQDNGTNLKTGSTWRNIGGGDGGECFIDPTNNNIVYTQYVQGAFGRTDDGGANVNDIVMGLPAGFDFYSQWVMDPVNSSRLYVGGIPTLYTSANRGDLWTALGTPSGTGSIKGIAVAPSNTTIIYTIKDDAVSKSINTGVSFSNITGTLPVANAALSSITVSNTDPNKVWVTFSGYSAGEKVYKTINGGTSWTNVSAGLPNLPVNVVVYTKASTVDAIYIGADIGVYYLDNSAASFAPFFTSLPNVAVRDLEIFYPTGKLRAATYGRGIWESDINTVVLPIKLVKFDVTLKGKNDALLQWQSASENNFSGYEIQIAEGNASYKKVGFVAGKGTTTSLNNYENVVPNLLPGVYYFRLKSIDLDGKFTYSPIRTLKINAGTGTDFVRIYPNPSNDGIFNIELQKTDYKKITIKVTNTIGQVVTSQDFTNYSNPLVIKLPAVSGEYYIQITTDDGTTIVKKLVTVK